MIVRLNTEENLNTAVEVRLVKTSEPNDTLTFQIPIENDIKVDEIIRVRSKVFKQDYRVKEVVAKGKYKEVFCEHVFFDCKNIIIPLIDEKNRSGENNTAPVISYNDFSKYTTLENICGHLNRIIRAKGLKDFVFDTDIKKSGTIECDDTPLYDLIFGEKGILQTFECHVIYDNYKVRFVKKIEGKNTEILFHESKNISELQETVDFKNIITKFYVSCKQVPDNSEEGKAERERLKAQIRREKFEEAERKRRERFEATRRKIRENFENSKLTSRQKFDAYSEKIHKSQEDSANKRAEKRAEEEAEYNASDTKPKKTKEQIHAEKVEKQLENERKILARNEARALEREKKYTDSISERVKKYNEREALATSKFEAEASERQRKFEEKEEERERKREEKKEEVIFKTVVESPLIGFYGRPYEANLSFSSSEISSQLELEEWCAEHLFTEEDTRDVPTRNFTFKPVSDDYNIDVADKAKVIFDVLGINKVINCCKLTYDPLHDKYIEIEFGELTANAMKQTIGSINSKIDSANSNIRSAMSIMDKNIFLHVQKEIEAFDELFESRVKEIEDSINLSLEDAKIHAEEFLGEIATNITESIAETTEEATNYTNEFNANINAIEEKLQGLSFEGADGLKKEINDNIEEKLNKVEEFIAHNNEGLYDYIGKESEKLHYSLTNQIINANLLKGTRDYTGDNWGNSLSTWSKESEKFNGLTVYSKDTNFIPITYTYPVKAGVTYTFSVWIKKETLGEVSLSLGNKTEDIVLTTGDWNRISITTQATRDETVSLKFNNKGNGKVSVAGFKLEKSDKYTAWCPNEEDEDSNILSVVSEFKQKDTELLNKITTLEQYKNEDSQRVNALKSWVQSNTSEKLEQQRSILEKFVNDKGYMQESKFNNKFTESANEIYRKLSSLETYKNEDGKRTELIKASITKETTDKLVSERTAIERWVTGKGYVTDAVMNQKVVETANTFNRTISTLRNGVVNYADVTIDETGINLGKGKKFDGRTLASILNISDESIQAITNRLVITSNSESIVKSAYKDKEATFSSDTVVTETVRLTSPMEYHISCNAISEGYNNRYRFKAKLLTDDGASINLTCIPDGYIALKGNSSFTFRISDSTIDGKKYTKILFEIDRYGTVVLSDLKIIQKKSAELIVDGSITGRQIKAESITGGEIKAGTVNAIHLATNSVDADKINVNEAFIRKLLVNNLLAKEIVASRIMVEKLNAIEFDFTKGTGDYIQSKDGNMRWWLNYNFMELRKGSHFLFKDFGNAITLEGKGGTSAGLNFTGVIGTDQASVALGTNIGVSYNANSNTFTGIRAISSDSEVGLFGRNIYITDTFIPEGSSIRPTRGITLRPNFMRMYYGKEKPHGIYIDKDGVYYMILGTPYHFYGLHDKINKLIATCRTIINSVEFNHTVEFELPTPYY